MKCPKCASDMAPVVHEDIEVDRCGTCGALWFDAREAEKLRAIAGSEVIDTGVAAAQGAPERTGPRPCPVCHTPMIGMTVHRQPHIRFESCKICYGWFLDAGEFADLKQLTWAEWLKSVWAK